MKTLRCMAYQQDGVFVAVCLDLSLAAQADTMQEVMVKLEEQIKDYLLEASSEPEYARQLLSRKAPASMWFKYWLIALKIKLFSRKQERFQVFREHCSALA